MENINIYSTEKYKKEHNIIGCGKPFNMNHSYNGFYCGIPNGNGQETFCVDCKQKMKAKWREEDIYSWKLKGCKVIKLK